MEKELMIHQEPKSPIAEVFRTLRTNIQFMTANKGLKSMLVTSSVPGEGKSWVSANLAIAFAQEGKKVILVDSDMRKGRIHTLFGIKKSPGLSNFLSGVSEVKDKENILDYLKVSAQENLYILTSGDVPPNPSELLSSQKISQLIKSLNNMFDMIIFDGTPCLLVTDSLILARQLDSTLIITAHKQTKMGDVEKIKKMVENVGGKIAGIVINKIPISSKKYESTYYYGRSKEDSKQEEQTLTKEQIESKEKPEMLIEKQIQTEVEEFIEKEQKEEKPKEQ